LAPLLVTFVGRSDPYVFEWYSRQIRVDPGSRVLFLGQPRHNLFTESLGVSGEFRDITLGNWDINGPLIADEKFDAIVCTRCAYFSEDPARFLSDCKRSARQVFVDWGLGDHWRFPKYRVGWRDQEEHEYADYGGRRNFLHSTVWRGDFLMSPEVQKFERLIQRYGYTSLEIAVRTEVPSLHTLGDEWVCSFLTLWPESPQLYVLTSWKEE
jgi:hypothetical protein